MKCDTNMTEAMYIACQETQRWNDGWGWLFLITFVIIFFIVIIKN
jgi:hypothetical protein